MTQDALSSTPVRHAGAGAGGMILERVVHHRRTIVSSYLAVSLVALAGTGAPDRPTVLWWLVGLAAITCVGAERGARRFVMDWLPLLVIAAGYDTVRAQAPDLLSRAIVRPQLHFDEALFGGVAPTVRLQRLLGVQTGVVHWWDYPVWLGYLSHFVVTLVITAFLYVTDRARFRRLAALIVTVSLAGFVTYFIVPAVPPWLASRQGALTHTTRIVQQVWAHLGLTGIAKVFDGSTQFANPVASLPSLHAAWPFMLLLFFWPTAKRGRWVLLAYNMFMWFVVLYGAEHYAADIMLGWCYSIVVFVAFTRYWAWRDARTSTASSTREATSPRWVPGLRWRAQRPADGDRPSMRGRGRASVS